MHIVLFYTWEKEKDGKVIVKFVTNLSERKSAWLHSPTTKKVEGKRVTKTINIVDETQISIKLVLVSQLPIKVVHLILMVHFYCLQAEFKSWKKS